MTAPTFPGTRDLPVLQHYAESLNRHVAMANAYYLAGDKARYDRHMFYVNEAMLKIGDARANILKERFA